jgi:hypothetical protein
VSLSQSHAPRELYVSNIMMFQNDVIRNLYIHITRVLNKEVSNKEEVE